MTREEWRPIPGHDGYEVSNLGRVRSYRAHGGNSGGRRIAEPRLKVTSRHKPTGYLSVVLQAELGRSQRYAVHVLVAQAFLGPRPAGYQVAHADGDKMNARRENLRYATAVENAQDKVGHGTVPVGQRNGNHKLTEGEVRELVARYRVGARQVDLADAFGISQSQVSNLVRRACWSHLNLTETAS